MGGKFNHGLKSASHFIENKITNSPMMFYKYVI